MRSIACRSALAAALSLAALTAETAPPPARQGFGEKLAVRETEIVFGPSDDLGNRDATPQAFRVLEDGHERAVARAERLPKDTPWSIVLYVDRSLASPETGFLAALALAQASDELARRASVELVVADPEPKTVVAPTREAPLLRLRLSDLANELRQRRDKSPRPGATARPLDAVAVRRQLERLVLFLASRPRPAPRALFLLADSIDLPAPVLRAVDRDRVALADLPAGGAGASFVAAAQLLAAYGWVTLPMPVHGLDLGVTGRPGAEHLDNPVGPPSGFGVDLMALFRRLRGRRPRRPVDPRRSQIGSDPRLALLRAVARTTGGEVLGYPETLGPALEGLGWRWHLWFSAPSTAEGKIHAVTVELVRTGETLRAPQWVRSGVPEGLADARLGALLAGSPPAGDLPVELRVERAGDEATVTLRLRTPLPAGTGPLRLSLATDAGGTLRRHVLDGAAETVRVTVPSGARRLAAVVEELEGERWGGAVAALE